MIIRDPYRYAPIWLHRRLWQNGRKRGDGIYWPAPLEMCRRMHWEAYPTFRCRWHQPLGWQRDASLMWSGIGPLPF